MKWFERPIHPILIAAYPILYLASVNLQEIPLGLAWRALLLAELAAIVLTLVLRLGLRSWSAGAILCSFSLLLFFSYGHIYDLIKGMTVGTFIIGRHRYLIMVWAALAAGMFFAVRKAGSASLLRAASILNLVGSIALVFPVVSIALSTTRSLSVNSVTPSAPQDSELHYVGEGTPPDIYYIILDSYGREDVLRDLYGMDNAAFISALRERGFYVAGESVANHVSTGFSLASSLNLDYVQNLGIDLPPGTYPGPLIDPIRASIVRTELERLGYSIVALSSGWAATSIIDADYFLTPEMLADRGDQSGSQFQPNKFESLLIETTVLRSVLDIAERRAMNSFLQGILSITGREDHRQLVLAAFSHLQAIPALPSPKFVFAHIISPHRPYLFGPEGETIRQTGPATFEDTDSSAESAEEAQEYFGQLLYINQRTLQAIDRIQEGSATEPIIILQSDTGPAFGLDWAEPDPTNLETKIAILNAIYFPDGCQEDLYPQLSPVNTFRILLNCYFDGDFELLEDRTYFTNHHDASGYRFVPIETLLGPAPTAVP